MVEFDGVHLAAFEIAVRFVPPREQQEFAEAASPDNTENPPKEIATMDMGWSTVSGTGQYAAKIRIKCLPQELVE